MATGGNDQPKGDSPSSEIQEKFNYILEAVRSGIAHLERGSDGNVRVLYGNEKRIPLDSVDQSEAHTVREGMDPNDVNTRVSVLLEIIEVIKKHGLVAAMDESKAKPSTQHSYEEGKQFTKLEEVLGKGNFAGDVVVVKDKTTDTEQAMKAVMITEFRTDEVRAWVNLHESESFVTLYLFRIDGKKVVFHMEKVENGVTLTDIIDNHMGNLWRRAPGFVQPFSLCMFHGLLSVVKEMHDKNWAHCDLHGGNVLLTKDSMTLKVLDFGMARQLQQGLGYDHGALKNDILNVIRLFCGLYIGEDFKRNRVLETQIEKGTLEKLLAETRLSEEDRKELLQLILMTYQVTQNPNQAGYRDTSPVMRHIEQKVLPKKIMDVMKTVAAVLFPDFHSVGKNLRIKGEREVMDGTKGGQMEDEGDFDMDAQTAEFISSVTNETLNSHSWD